MILKWSRVSRRSVFYPNNLAMGVLMAGMRFNRPNRVTLRLKQMGFFLARLLAGAALCVFANFPTWKFLAYHAFPLLILVMALLAAALLGRPLLAGAELFFRGFLTNLLKSPNLSSYQCLFFILLFLSSFSESLGMVGSLLLFLRVVTVGGNSPVSRTAV